MQLNVEQKKLIQSKPNGHSIIKGVAGSGKTTVAVNRIPFLLNHYCFAKDDRILMVTYNKTLISYIGYLYEKVKEEDKVDYQSLFASDNNKMEIYTIDKIIYKYFQNYKDENKLNLDFVRNNKEKYTILAQCIFELQKIYKNVNVLDQKHAQFLLDEIDWIKACNYMELEEYQNVDRIGRTGKQNIDRPQKLMKNSETRRAIYELMLLYNKRLKENKYVDFKDIALIALKQARKKVDKKYTHIIIDESQDLTRVQIEFLKELYLQKEYSSITFVADTAQSIYNHSWLVKGRSFTSVGFDMTGKSNSLSKNYRTTTQIAESAYSLIENDTNIIEDENFVKASLIDKQGKYPVYRHFKEEKEEINYVINEIENKLLNKYSYRDIAVIARNTNYLNNAKNSLEAKGMPCNLIDRKDSNFESNGVKLLTMHSIKGLEFKVVIIIGVNEGIIPFKSYYGIDDSDLQETIDRKLLYVGMTRANDLLYLTSSKAPSKFIKDINPHYLKMNSNSKINAFYDLHIDDFIFKDKVSNLYSNEEKVRQWILKELKENYKYPLNLLEIEYKVNNFSRVGSVDIVVSIYKNNKMVPFIFIETKSYGAGIKSGLQQLKSYMGCNNVCQYGIVTDGNEFLVIDKDYEMVEDIPSFDYSMLPSSILTYKYMDLKHNNIYEIEIDKDNNNDEIFVNYNVEKKQYIDNDIKRLNIHSNIAAGSPIYMNEEIEGEFTLPREWFNPSEEYFILKIKGDSMQGADINDGDFVVIQRQQSAQNRDIVAVSIDDNATLKRFMKMGDTILLIPENEKYEPIQIKDNQASIIGIAIGVLKYRN